jgi:hypothetical protein
MRRPIPVLLPVLLLVALPAGAEPPAPPLGFAAGAVLAGGHVLREAVTLPARPGPVTLPLRDGAPLHWRVTVEHGETQLLDERGRWAAKAEYHRLERDGRVICQIYQTTIAPEWALRGARESSRADFSPADDRIYSFREVPCP